MDRFIKKALSSFPKSDFTELKSRGPTGGAFVARISLAPAAVFELLEAIYGPYEDQMSEYVFIDDKTTWERTFETRKGILRVYDFKGTSSIGYGGQLTKGLGHEGEKFKTLLEGLWPAYLLAKRKQLGAEIKREPLRNFMRTFLATRSLLKRAQESSSFLEALVLLATVTDAQLRYGILLLRQIRNKTAEYERALIHQQGDTYLSERTIQKMALEEGFLSKAQYKEISALYGLRNKAVHRYFISDFEYVELPKILNRYEKLRIKFGEKLSHLEKKQAKEKVGMIRKEDIIIDESFKKKVVAEEKLKLDSRRPTAVVKKRKYLFPREFGTPQDTTEFE